MQKSVELTYGAKTLRGMMHIPDSTSGKVPMVAIFHGFTGNKVESHFIFVKLSRELEKAGIGSVRFDFYGSGESDGDFMDMTFSGEVEDARHILEFVKNHPATDVDNIGILGLSMGGAIAAIIAKEYKDIVKSLVLWAPAFNMRDIVELQQQSEAGNLLSQHGFVDIGGLALGQNFVFDMIKTDIFQSAKGYDKDVLIIHGTKDEAVPYTVSEEILRTVYKEKGKRISIDGSDHTFNRLDWQKRAIDESVSFLKEKLR
ncbi:MULTISPECIES: alpha/beta hydrolase [Thermoanaerobacterium]|uniref:Alpha/beta hydrolase fold containing protein n=2 Tax=Thermoanaerobacterium TaxID=28895 RepID=W9EBX2_9THEO|nr:MULTISPECIES: alpha/beta hydrolase [Thermoanaerobacterium]AFK86394.1 alpha/beta hydrolase fold containing protein [Thermoanaerobacterium saccharolyticum JW/SL-YS485]ETO38490.1 alpha/beta hydrolase fold containing protein [Thermoanaerobacterium aotearoense SCUT27]